MGSIQDIPNIERKPNPSRYAFRCVRTQTSSGSEFPSEGFEVRAADRQAVQVVQFGGDGDLEDLLAQPLRDPAETDIKDLDDRCLQRFQLTFLPALLATFLVAFLPPLLPALLATLLADLLCE